MSLKGWTKWWERLSSTSEIVVTPESRIIEKVREMDNRPHNFPKPKLEFDRDSDGNGRWSLTATSYSMLLFAREHSAVGDFRAKRQISEVVKFIAEINERNNV